MPYYGEQKREYDRQWMAARRAAWFADKTCVVCGTKDNLEVHHIDPDTKADHRVWSWSKVRRDAELAKCEVRCETHHMDMTRPYLSKLLTIPLSAKKHGTNNTYNHYGCRCDKCREWRRSKYKRLGT
jgi:hypothetical protein